MGVHHASRIVRWGILGSSKIANDFAHDLKLVSNAKLVSVCSRDLANARQFAFTHGHIDYFDSVESMLTASDPDVIYIATPPALHSKHAIQCLSAKKAVLVEKPFAASLAEGQTIVDQARKSGVFCMEAMWMRFMPVILRAREYLSSGTIGEPRMITADFGVPMEFSPGNHFYDPAWGGGALLDRGVYPISLALDLFGEPDGVTARITKAPTGVDDLISIILTFPSGNIASLSAYLSAYGSNEAVILGTHGRIRIHEPMCRPDAITITKRMPLQGSDSASYRSNSYTAWLKNRFKESSLFRRLRHTHLLQLMNSTKREFIPYQGNGYFHEANEVTQCIISGQLESPCIPLDNTLLLLRVIDAVRNSWEIL